MPDDYIKRSDINDAKRKWLENENDHRSFAKVIRDIPAADVAEVKHGRWIKMTGMMPPEFHGHYECSKCEWRGKHDIEREYRYCPNCGAKME